MVRISMDRFPDIEDWQSIAAATFLRSQAAGWLADAKKSGLQLNLFRGMRACMKFTDETSRIEVKAEMYNTSKGYAFVVRKKNFPRETLVIRLISSLGDITTLTPYKIFLLTGFLDGLIPVVPMRGVNLRYIDASLLDYNWLINECCFDDFYLVVKSTDLVNRMKFLRF